MSVAIDPKVKLMVLLYMKQRKKYLYRRKKTIAAILKVVNRRKRIFPTLLALIHIQTNEIVNFDTPRVTVRSCRRFICNTGWWDTVWTRYTDDRFKRTFRVSRGTFMYVLSFIHDKIHKQFITEKPISAEMRLGLCLYRISRGDYLYTIAEMAGIAESTVCQIIIEVSEAIVETMWPDAVDKHFPKTESDFKTAMLDMDEEWQFPYAFCGIDGSHLPIKCPDGGGEAMKQYYNFKNFYSVILLALVDAKYRFIWCSLGAPGHTHDSTYFQTCSLWNNIIGGNFLPNKVQVLENVEIPPMILGDGAFPLRTWMVKPHGDAVLSEEKRILIIVTVVLEWLLKVHLES